MSCSDFTKSPWRNVRFVLTPRPAVHASSGLLPQWQPSVVWQVTKNRIKVQDKSRYVWKLIDVRSGKPLVLAPEEPSFHAQVRTILHMSVERSRVRRVRRPYRAMPSRPMCAQIRLVLGPTRVYAFVRFRDFLVEPFDLRRYLYRCHPCSLPDCRQTSTSSILAEFCLWLVLGAPEALSVDRY
jgi:hypothetical protein